MSDAITRKEAYLKSIGDGTSSALKPITREEQYLAYIAGESNSFPTNPITREEAFLDKIAKKGAGGGGSGINVQPLTVTENGTWDAPDGQAYDPVIVNVASGGGGAGEVSAIIKPLTITHNGTYTAVAGGELKYDTTVKFKQTITADDFATYTATATISQSANGANIYTIFDDWALMSPSTGDSPMYIIQNRVNSLLPLYTFGMSAMGMADGWKLSDQTIVDDPPMVSVPEGATMSADLETTAVFFNLERVDAYAPITVKSKEVSAMIAMNGAYIKNETLYDDFVTDTRQYAFASCYTFRTIELPNVTNISSYCFKQCGAEIVKLPKATEIGVEAFNTSYIRYLDLSSCTELDATQIDNNNSLEKLKLNSITKITGTRTSHLYLPDLTALILGGETVCEIFEGALDYCYHITGETNYSYNPDGLKDGYIYVPKALVETYKTATNWSKYASQFRAIEDYPEECEF